MRLALYATLLTGLAVQTAAADTFSVDVWADNWFAMQVNGTEVAQDSVPITTERSFNAESFTFDAQRPFTVGVIAKDFKENDTGLEYIGSRRQQMGDGGLILQITDAAGQVVTVSNSDWRCFVTHSAPLDKSCAREADPVAGSGPCGFETAQVPAGWDSAGFDDSGWPSAQVFSAAQVRPKGGYDQITWDSGAQLIWGPDLETSNTVLCRLTVD